MGADHPIAPAMAPVPIAATERTLIAGFERGAAAAARLADTASVTPRRD